MTTEKNFKNVTAIIKRDLDTAVTHYTKEFPLDKSHPPVGLAFNGTQDDDNSSDGSFNLYLSSCSTVFDDRLENYSAPPATSSPAIQAWGPTTPNIPKDVHSTTTTQVVSGISSATYNEVDREKEQMAREISELKAQVQALLQKSTTPAPTTPGIDIQAIVAHTTAAVMKEMLKQQQNLKRPIDELAAGSEANATSDAMNTSTS